MILSSENIMKVWKFLFFSFLFCLACSSGEYRDFNTLKEQLEEQEFFAREEVHKGLKGNFMFYVSQEKSKGDIWLYNLDTDSKWRITDENNQTIKLIYLSPFYKYLVYNVENKNRVFNIGEKEQLSFTGNGLPLERFYKIKNINWINEDGFYFLSSTNKKTTNIFVLKITQENRYFIKDFDISLKRKKYNGNFYSLSLSHNNRYLAFIYKAKSRQRYIYVYDLENHKIKKLVSVKSFSPLL